MYLGDALDPWKGSLFKSLQREKLVDDFAVDPMAGDLSSWRDEDFQLLARLLRVGRRQLLPHRASLTDRHKYFEEITYVGDLSSIQIPVSRPATSRDVSNMSCPAS